MKIVILYSSGLDSKIMYHLAKVKYPHADIKCIYYLHGAASENAEVSQLPDFVEMRTVDWLGDKIKPVAKKEDPFAGAIYIPGRNLIFSALAACQELADEVWLGALADECNEKGTDKNEKFRNDTSELLSYVLSPFIDKVTVRFPFVEEGWTKVDSVKWALENGMSAEDISETVSCWHQTSEPCGQCKQCFKRQLVFRLNNLREICRQDPIESDFGKEMIKGYVTTVMIDGSKNLDEVNVSKMILQLYNQGSFSSEIQQMITQILGKIGK